MINVSKSRAYQILYIYRYINKYEPTFIVIEWLNITRNILHTNANKVDDIRGMIRIWRDGPDAHLCIWI